MYGLQKALKPSMTLGPTPIPETRVTSISLDIVIFTLYGLQVSMFHMELLKEIPQSVLMVIVVVLLWIAKELWEMKKKSSSKEADLLQQNTFALIELKVEVKGLKEAISPLLRKIEGIEEDMNSLHDAKRAWQKRDQ